ncbi:MAG: hypothetical protein LPK45_11845 [Bacteroidota bacterium]|nr:hypothetical protein [Bacteroidota bacterium]MDX5431804.1 hypothetical protein [Bacteroidota bacterium]MDX5470515.1 hypothetical protein [Bacteroidota bacterium]
MKRTLGLFLFALSVCYVSGQYSLRDTFSIYLAKEPNLYLSLDGRSSFVRNQPAQIDGFRFGLSYGGKIRLLAGMYRLRRPIYRTYLYGQGTPNQEERFQENRLTYFAFTCDYVLYNRKRWKLALPVQLGYGFGNRVERNSLGEVRLDKEFRFVPFELALSANYRILPWLNCGAGLGYRYALFSNAISSDFSAPIYWYGMSIDVEWFWDNYFKDVIEHKRQSIFKR